MGGKPYKTCLSSFSTYEDKSLTLYYTNTDCFLNKRTEFEETVSSKKPDIIILVEVLPKNGRYNVQKAELKLKNYSLYKNFTGEHQECRGIIIYIHNGIKSYQASISGYSTFKEFLLVEVILNNKKQVVWIYY